MRKRGPSSTKPFIPEGGGAICACRLLPKPIKPSKPNHSHTSLEVPIADFQPLMTHNAPKSGHLFDRIVGKIGSLVGQPRKIRELSSTQVSIYSRPFQTTSIYLSGG